MITINNETYETGCYFAGHRGWRITADVARFAASVIGHEFDMEEDEVLAAFENNEDTPVTSDPQGYVCEMCDEMVNLLNDQTPDNFLWQFHDGDFGLSPFCGGDEDCEDDTCACID